MKPGSRALGVAESYEDDASTLAGAVVRADRTVDGLIFGSCTVGGTDATDAITALWRRLNREDVRHVMIAGVAPAWFNILSLDRIHTATDRPVLAVTFEAGDPLEEPIHGAFEGAELDRRLAAYEQLPPRTRVDLGGEPVWVRNVGLPDSEAGEVLRAYTHDGRRPEPLHVARIAARAADAWRRSTGDTIVRGRPD